MLKKAERPVSMRKKVSGRLPPLAEIEQPMRNTSELLTATAAAMDGASGDRSG
ncbi:hypothetical protein JNB91_17395 [Rhizobium wenxiniae]|uniref:hypothetical protein n=1 Tax=Rhizobium wenxiniae TaxID=1737357 RepID=UPI001C6E3E26|nr:hypothetical protein [Rhizobium wenxiniae]MBW9089601.1 hypothetical protein [Rhizobium wenxiniae]